MNTYISSVSIFLIALFRVITSDVVKGVTPLNSGTFDKIVPRFKFTLVKFDKPYPSGEKQKAFKEFALETTSQTELLVGEVSVKDYGEKENSDLAERFNVKKEDFPQYKLFIQGRADPIDYTGDESKADDIKKFLIQETGLWLGLPACIEEFDTLSKAFFTASSTEARKAVLKICEDKANLISDETQKTRANVYVKTMQKVLESGKDFIKTELERVEKLSAGKVSEKKKAQLRDRASILTSMQLRMKDEL